MASGHTGNVVPGNRLRVRLPCPPLFTKAVVVKGERLLVCAFANFFVSQVCAEIVLILNPSRQRNMLVRSLLQRVRLGFFQARVPA
jgi:hypothetical protein